MDDKIPFQTMSAHESVLRRQLTALKKREAAIEQAARGYIVKVADDPIAFPTGVVCGCCGADLTNDGKDGHEVRCPIGVILQSDVGSDYIHRSGVQESIQPLVRALEFYAHHWKDMGTERAKQALAHAKECGWLVK